MNKRISSIIILAMIAVLCFGSTAFANNLNQAPADKMIFEKAEITDINQLTVRAKAGISDLPINQLPKSDSTCKLEDESGQVVSVPTYVTAQVLNVKENANNITSSQVVVTKIAEVPTILRGGGQSYKYDEDPSYSVRAYSTIYYQATTIDGVTYYYLDSVSGGWTILDSQVSLSDREVIYGYGGTTTSGNYYTRRSTPTPTSNTFSYNPSWSTYVDSLADASFLSCSMHVVITRGGTSYNFDMLNALF